MTGILRKVSTGKIAKKFLPNVITAIQKEKQVKTVSMQNDCFKEFLKRFKITDDDKC